MLQKYILKTLQLLFLLKNKNLKKVFKYLCRPYRGTKFLFSDTKVTSRFKQCCATVRLWFIVT